MAESTSYFDKWYEKNKDSLSAKRRVRYHSDPEYRLKVIERGRLARMARRGEDIPEGYKHHMVGAAEALGVTLWTFREWRKKNYFPEPTTFKGRRWFTARQIELLAPLRDFFSQHGRRTSAEDKPALENLVSIIYANWNH